MAKIYKAQIYLTDYNDEIQDLEDLKEDLKDLGDYLWIGVDIGEIKESKEFEWDDDLKINSTDATIADFEEYFKDE